MPFSKYPHMTTTMTRSDKNFRTSTWHGQWAINLDKTPDKTGNSENPTVGCILPETQIHAAKGDIPLYSFSAQSFNWGKGYLTGRVCKQI